MRRKKIFAGACGVAWVAALASSGACGAGDEGEPAGRIDASAPSQLVDGRSDRPETFSGDGDLSACHGDGSDAAPSAVGWVQGLEHPTAYAPIDAKQAAAVTAAVKALVAGDVAGARAEAALASYAIAPLRLPTECLWAMRPSASAPPGGATLLVRPAFDHDLVLEAPHVPNDHGTDVEAALVFDLVGARALLVAGADRCAVHTASGCHPNKECEADGTAVESDVAHAVDSAFQAMHLALATTARGTRALQLHTNLVPSLNGDAIVSDGTWSDDSPVTRAFASALRDLTGSAAIEDCGDTKSPPPAGAFCGEINAQSLASNGAPDACTGPLAASSRALFFHLEQDSKHLVDPVGWSQLVAQAAVRAGL